MTEDLKKMYKTIVDDHFSPRMEISFVAPDSRQTLFYEKVTWHIGGQRKGLDTEKTPGRRRPSIDSSTAIFLSGRPSRFSRDSTWRPTSNCCSRASIPAKRT